MPANTVSFSLRRMYPPCLPTQSPSPGIYIQYVHCIWPKFHPTPPQSFTSLFYLAMFFLLSHCLFILGNWFAGSIPSLRAREGVCCPSLVPRPHGLGTRLALSSCAPGTCYVVHSTDFLLLRFKPFFRKCKPHNQLLDVSYIRVCVYIWQLYL